MLRDNSESFAPEFSKILSQLGVHDEAPLQTFQLQKFERLEPDAFIWMLSGKYTYIMTIVDGGSSAPLSNWLATWAGGLKTGDLQPLVPRDVDGIGRPGLKDGYDFIQVYRLPEDYDHTNEVA